MKKLNRVAALFAVAAVATSGVMAQTVDNWRATDGTVWKNGTNELCWRDAFWTPATAAKDCDGALKPVAAPVAAPAAPAPAPAVTPAPAPKPVVAPTSEKVTYAADAFFDGVRLCLAAGEREPQNIDIADQRSDEAQRHRAGQFLDLGKGQRQEGAIEIDHAPVRGGARVGDHRQVLSIVT